LHLSKFISIN